MAKNFQLNSVSVLRDVYRLLSLVLGDEDVLEVANGDSLLLSLRDEFLADELSIC